MSETSDAQEVGRAYDKSVNRLHPKTFDKLGPGKHHDGAGLYLVVDRYGKRWLLRIKIDGKYREIGLGSAGLVPGKVGIAEARTLAEERRAKVRLGVNPIAEKEAKRAAAHASAVPTFQEAAEAVYAQRRQEWSNGKHQAQWISTLVRYAFPAIGRMPVNEVGTAEVLMVLSPIWSTKRETARRVKQRIETVLDWAKVKGFRSGDNPVEFIMEALPKHKNAPKHHASLPHGKVAEFIGRLRAGQGEPETKAAFEFLILTATRSNEVHGAQWDEIDLEAKTWTIPAKRMKTRDAHQVPLSDRAIELLQGLPGHRRGRVFKDASTGAALSENRFLNARDGLGYTSEQCTPHGFRSSFRNWVGSQPGVSHDVAEACLAHKVKGKQVAAYLRDKFLEERRPVMEAWARYVEPNRSVNVIPLHKAV